MSHCARRSNRRALGVAASVEYSLCAPTLEFVSPATRAQLHYGALHLQKAVPVSEERAEEQRGRRIRSFVRRDSRITKAQAHALDAHLAHYRFEPEALSRQHFNSLNLEIGAGDGECTLALARKFPHEAFVASEVYRVGLGRILHAVNTEKLQNVRVAETDVMELLPSLPDRFFDRVMVFFPDPWPKKRHHKRRLIQAPFLVEVARVLRRSGRLFVATDIEDYAIHVLEQIEISMHWRNLAGTAKWAIRPHFRVQTKFETKGLAAGRRIFDIIAAPVVE